MFKCLNKWNNFNDLDGYCNGEPEMESEPVYAEVDTKKILPRYGKCKCNENECLKYQSWIDVCKQRQGYIDWLNKSEERQHLIHN